MTTPTLRGRVWRAADLDISTFGHPDITLHGGWNWEIVDRHPRSPKILKRGTEATQQAALGRACHQIRLNANPWDDPAAPMAPLGSWPPAEQMPDHRP